MSTGLTICDLSPFYCEGGGGIRTYHRQRLEWFASQNRHRYVLVCPGRRRATTWLAPSSGIAEVYGPRVSRRRGGYRLMVDLSAVTAAIRRFVPDVLESGDPWISGPVSLVLRQRGHFRGLLASFYHSDPVATYFEPRSTWLASAGRQLVRLQRLFDVTVVASRIMAESLASRGVPRVHQAPFGVDPSLFAIPRDLTSHRSDARLLYAGRLDSDKEIQLLIRALPMLLEQPHISVSVAGSGKLQSYFERLAHPRFRYLGFISDRDELARAYASHTVALAPGRFETFGLATLEALAAGLVVVGPRAGGTGEILDQMTRPFLFQPGNAEDFLRVALQAAEGVHGEAIADGRRVASRYGGWPLAVARHVGLYESLVEVQGQA